MYGICPIRCTAFKYPRFGIAVRTRTSYKNRRLGLFGKIQCRHGNPGIINPLRTVLPVHIAFHDTVVINLIS